MPNIIEITDFNAPELDVYARLTEAQLLNAPMFRVVVPPSSASMRQ